jgi:hypothetical protein
MGKSFGVSLYTVKAKPSTDAAKVAASALGKFGGKKRRPTRAEG